MRRLTLLSVLLVSLLTAGPAAARKGPVLRAGAGQADITPPQTGYYLGGWTRADRLGTGVSSRIFANALALQRGRKHLALVAVELFAVPAGLQEDVAKAVADLGYNRTSVVLAASHTHSGPGGFTNNPTYNTAAPSPETIGDPLSFYEFVNPEPADRQLYTFMVNQIAAAIRRADADKTPAAAAWGRTRLVGLTQNRSIEAHLANHGMKLDYGAGSPDMDPDGPLHTIDPKVDVLRVDKLRRGRRVPIGAWSNFADHGTVVHSEFQAYSGDHHASAWRHFVARVRKAGRVPKRQTVVNVYPNSDEGDQTAGIVNVGPAAADRVGRVEAGAMFRAWRRAGKRLKKRPAIAGRWTRTCFCGRETKTGPVDSQGRVGAGFLTGSEEGRGPLYDITGVPFEGKTSPNSTPEQGNKYVVEGAGNPPPAVPISVWRIADGAIASVPGEATKEVGLNIKRAVSTALGLKRVVIAGLAGDYIQYISTPEEYGQQSYEGASSLWGPNEGTFFVERFAELSAALKAGKPAEKPYDLDPSYGVKPDGAPFGTGAEAGKITEQPADVQRLQRATLTFTGAPKGNDMPVDRAFLTAQRLVKGKWRRYADDLGLQFLWRAGDDGVYHVEWEVPLSAPAGTYRLRVSAQRYGLASETFTVSPSSALKVASLPGGVRLEYPKPVVNEDLTHRPVAARGGVVDGKRFKGTVAPVSGPVSSARDRYGNTAG